MSDPAFDPDAMLQRLALLDMAAAERAHAKLMAADEPAEVADLARSYERAARSVRQTLALHARLRREAAVEARRAELLGERAAHLQAMADDEADETPPPPDTLETAARAWIRAEYDPSEAERLEDGLDDIIDRLWSDDFAELDVDHQAAALIAHIRKVVRPKAPTSAPRAPAAPSPETAAPAAPPSPAPNPPPRAPREAAAPEPEGEPEPAQPDPDTPSEPPPPQPPPEPWPEPYVPPWEMLKPGQSWPGSSGW